MHRTTGTNNVNGLYTDSPPATTITAAAMNAIQEEIATVIENAGLVLKVAGNDDHTQLDSAIRSLFVLPAGLVGAFPVSGSPPTGWLVCDGTAVSRSTYADLFAVIGTVYGVGDGSTTFDLPDFQGQFLRGVEGGVSEPIGTAQDDAFQAFQVGIDHDGTGPRDYWGEASGRDNYCTTGVRAGDAGSQFTTAAQGSTKMLKPMDDGTNGAPRTDSETRPKNYAIQWIIKT